MNPAAWRRAIGQLVDKGLLPGLSDAASLERFIGCIEQSLTDHSAIRAGKNLPKVVPGPGPEFEPFAEIKRLARDDWREGVWLAGLVTAVGWDRPSSAGQLYNALYDGQRWTWARVADDDGESMARWIANNAATLSAVAKFGSHRQYETHRPTAPMWTGRVVRSLVRWLKGNPDELTPRTSDFHRLYQALEPVAGFGRTARYDFARLLGLLGLAPLDPRLCYFEGSSGPQRGARGFFGMPGATCAELEARAREVERALALTPMLLEDILCQASKA